MSAFKGAFEALRNAVGDVDADRILTAVEAEACAEQAAEIDRLRKELEPYEVLNPQQCPKGLHADWLVDSEHTHACPWCELDRKDELLTRSATAETNLAAERDDLKKRLGRAASIYSHSGSKPYHKGWNEAAAWVRDALNGGDR